jgi:hypothetical protein
MIRYLIDRDRPVKDVPATILVLLVLSLAMQLVWHSRQAPVVAKAEELPRPMSHRAYVMGSFGEPIAAAKVLNLWLQAFDNQPGISIPLHALDYEVVTDWLDTILALDPRGHYPMLVAARVYGSVSDREKQRQMMDYIFYKFNEDPNKHWRWLAHAVITAKHELKDMPLALKYAHALAEKATGENVPYWARDMKIIVLEDMGEIEAAKVLVGGLIASGEITDPYELNFLQNKIRVLEEKMTKNRQDVDK